MQKYPELSKYDLHAKLCMVKEEYLGRQSPVYDEYRGQFFWHINGINCTDWDAIYIFENGELKPGNESLCKIILSDNLKKQSKGFFPTDSQFCIREGGRIVAIGKILENKVTNA